MAVSHHTFPVRFPIPYGFTRVRVLKPFVHLSLALRASGVYGPPTELADKWIRQGLAIAAPVGSAVEESIVVHGIHKAQQLNYNPNVDILEAA